ncbi:MAG: hypothetical protein FJX62_12105 [Alphaproteobacteria bacterium]|nr:hypothetical protein [Alphaproteobacteria bacterium]
MNHRIGLTIAAVVLGCALTAAFAMTMKDASAMDMVQTVRAENGNAHFRLASLIDCSGCRTGGHCPNVCAKARPPQPAPSKGADNRNTHGCACLHNETNRAVNFRYRWGSGEWKVVNMKPDFQYAFCWKYAEGSKSSPDLKFELDVDMTKGSAWRTYDIDRMQTPGSTCNLVPAKAHFDVKYRPKTDNQFIAVYKRD